MKTLWAETTLLSQTSQTSMSDFSSSNFIVQDDILSTAGCSDKTEENVIKYTNFWCFFSSTTTYQAFRRVANFRNLANYFFKKSSIPSNIPKSKEEISKY
jgi:hypothetical protein